jgi:hypothetical protein
LREFGKREFENFGIRDSEFRDQDVKFCGILEEWVGEREFVNSDFEIRIEENGKVLLNFWKIGIHILVRDCTKTKKKKNIRDIFVRHLLPSRPSTKCHRTPPARFVFSGFLEDVSKRGQKQKTSPPPPSSLPLLHTSFFKVPSVLVPVLPVHFSVTRS